MLRIRLKRTGRKKRPYFQVVVAEHSNAAKGKYVVQLGGYDPLLKDGFKVDTDELLEWIKKGARPSDTIARLMKGKGFADMDRFIDPMANRKKKNPQDEDSSAPQAPTPVAQADANESEKPPVVPTEAA